VARGFRRTRHGLRAKLDTQERAVLAHLFVEVYELLDDGTQADPDPLAAMIGIGTAVDLPDDPALARLLPDAHKEDPEASSEFRRYTEQGLRDRKRQCLETARLTLGRDGTLTLDEGEAQSWLVALTDVRLVLAERMGLRIEEDHETLMRRLGLPYERDDDAALDEGIDEELDESFGVDEEGDDAGTPAVDDGSDARGSAPTSDELDDELDDDLLDDDSLDESQRLQLATMLSLYDFLTWLQESLVQAVCDE
jgi:hypothetical protein